MPGHDIIVIGASAGGVQVISDILRGLPHDLPAAVFVVIHTAPTSPGILPQILDRVCPLPVRHAHDGEPIDLGRVYVARPDFHLLIADGRIRVARGPKENGFRPAVDPLFRTAARTHGPRVIGVVLSGGLDDGTEGATLITRLGGVTIAQDPEEALFPSMPASAIRNDHVTHVLRVAEIPAALIKLVHEPVSEQAMAAMKENNGNGEPQAAQGSMGVRDVMEGGDNSLVTRDLPGPPSAFTCPECGGALWELNAGKLTKYRCHVGHAYTPEGLVAAQSDELETALWSALRALEENAALRRRMALRAADSGWTSIVREYERQAKDAEDKAATIRTVLLSGKTTDGHKTTEIEAAERDQAVVKSVRTGAKGHRGKGSPRDKQTPKASPNGRGKERADHPGAKRASGTSESRTPKSAGKRKGASNPPARVDMSAVPLASETKELRRARRRA